MAALQHACGKELITPPQPVDNRFREFYFCLYFVLPGMFKTNNSQIQPAKVVGPICHFVPHQHILNIPWLFSTLCCPFSIYSAQTYPL